MKVTSTVDKAAVPRLFQEPHIEKGYRIIHQPWSSYFLSLFQWHNEVMNVWTHLLAVFMVLIRGGIWFSEFDLLLDPYMWPLCVWLIVTLTLFGCSSGAHLFHSRSELAHNVCFMVDYVGIGLFGFGSTMMQYWYCGHEDFLGSSWHQAAVPFGAVLGVITCYCCVYSKMIYQRPYPYVRRMWQIGSVTVIYLWLSLPIWVKIGMYAYEGRWEPSFGDHIQQTLWFALSGFFFGSHIPERLFPGTGKFDFIGHSHQCFHLCLMMTSSKQMDGVYYDLTHGMETLRQTQAPTFLATWGLLFFVITGCALIVFYFYKSISKKLDGKDYSNGHRTSESKFVTKHSDGTIDSSDASSHCTNGCVEQKTRHRNLPSFSQSLDL